MELVTIKSQEYEGIWLRMHFSQSRDGGVPMASMIRDEQYANRKTNQSVDTLIGLLTQ